MLELGESFGRFEGGLAAGFGIGCFDTFVGIGSGVGSQYMESCFELGGCF